MGYPDVLNLICENFGEEISGGITCVAGSGLGGISLATSISQKYNLNLTLVRNDYKDHGLSNLIEGYIPNEKDRIIVVDDVFTTGSSLRETIKILTPTKAEIEGCYVVVKRGEENFPFKLDYLITDKDLIY